MRYYYSGLPYSDGLYHHGIPGQKWGVRRFQNSDGTLTDAGRRRYSKGDGSRTKGKAQGIGSKVASGAKEAGKAVGRAALKGAGRIGEGIARGVKTKLAEKLPFMLNDEEIAKYRDRLALENSYRSQQASRRELKKKSQGEQFLKNLGKDIISNSAKTIANKAVNKWADEQFKTKDEKRRESIEDEMKDLRNKAERERLAADKIKRTLETKVNEMKISIEEDMRKQKEDRDAKAANEKQRERAKENIRTLSKDYAKDNADLEDKFKNDPVTKRVRQDRLKREYEEKISEQKDEMRKAESNISKLDDRIGKRERSLKYRRSDIDILGTPQKNSKQSIADQWQSMSDEEKEELMSIIMSRR